jgi:hypothetical protein
MNYKRLSLNLILLIESFLLVTIVGDFLLYAMKEKLPSFANFLLTPVMGTLFPAVLFDKLNYFYFGKPYLLSDNLLIYLTTLLNTIWLFYLQKRAYKSGISKKPTN